MASAGRIDWRTRAHRTLTRVCLAAYLLTLRLLRRFGPAPRVLSGRHHILLTGTYQSHNWIRAHLGPLAACGACDRVTMVTTASLPTIPKVVAISPPAWLVAVAGATPARLLTFVVAGVRLALVDEQIAEIKSRLQRTNPVADADAYLELFGDLVPLEQYRIALREKAMGAVG